MSRAFVQGKDRPSMPKPEVPEGMVKVKDHGIPKNRIINRPLPGFPFDPDAAPQDPIRVGDDRTFLCTEAEATYLLTTCGGTFERLSPAPQPEEEPVCQPTN